MKGLLYYGSKSRKQNATFQLLFSQNILTDHNQMQLFHSLSLMKHLLWIEYQAKCPEGQKHEECIPALPSRHLQSSKGGRTFEQINKPRGPQVGGGGI